MKSLSKKDPKGHKDEESDSERSYYSLYDKAKKQI